MVNILGVTLIEFFFMYYRVYTLKHCGIILLHSYINYYTNEMAAIPITISSQLQT